MSPPEKSPELSGSAPPREPMTGFQVALAIERLRSEMRASAEAHTREFQLIREDLKTAKDNDERFKKLEHNFGLLWKLMALTVAAALAAFIQGLAARVSLRVADAPPPVTSGGASTALDRVSRPDAGRP